MDDTIENKGDMVVVSEHKPFVEVAMNEWWSTVYVDGSLWSAKRMFIPVKPALESIDSICRLAIRQAGGKRMPSGYKKRLSEIRKHLDRNFAKKVEKPELQSKEPAK